MSQEGAYDRDRDAYVLSDGTGLHLNCLKRAAGGVTYRRYRSRGRQKHELLIRKDEGLADKMCARLRSADGAKIYRLRKQIVEPVFGHLKGPMQLRRLLLRGLSGANIEYMLACMAHNLFKI